MRSARRTSRKSVPDARRPVAASRLWPVISAMTLVGLVAYANALNGPFILDDEHAIVGNESIRQLQPISRFIFAERESPVAGRPLVNLSFALNYAAHGLQVQGYHTTNLALHLLCGLALFGCIRRTLLAPEVPDRLVARSTDVAAAVTSIWLVHPLNSEIINYVTQRSELLMALCCLLTIYGIARSHQSPRARAWQAMSVVCCAAGMASKESMVTVPFLAVVYDRTFWWPSWRAAIAKRWGHYLGLAATWSLLVALMWSGPRAHTVGFDVGVSPWTYLLNQVVLITRYLWLTIWPRDLVVHYGAPRALALSDVLAPGLFVVCLGVLALVCVAKRPRLGFLGVWFFVILAPTSSVVPIATEVGAERRMYLPLAALVTLAVVGAVLLWRRVMREDAAGRPPGAAIGRGAAIVLVMLLLVGTAARNREYASRLTLAETVLARWPAGASHHMVGSALLLENRRAEGLAHLRRAVEGDPRAHFTLGYELFRGGEYDEAIPQLEAFVRKQPLLLEVVSARLILGQMFSSRGQYDAAEREFTRVLEMVPGHINAQVNLGDMLFAQARYREAIPRYRAYLTRRPASVGALTNIGIALAAEGQRDEALAAFRRAADLFPDDSAVHRNLANALLDFPESDEALAHAERAVSLAPQDAVSHDILGLAYMRSHRAEDALVHFREAVRLDAATAEYRDHLRGVERLLGTVSR